MEGKDAEMDHVSLFSLICVAAAGLRTEFESRVDEVLKSAKDGLVDELAACLSGGLTPESMFDLELVLEKQVREIARQILERLMNSMEPDDPEQAPHDVAYQGGGYRRLGRKTHNRNVSTRFGTVALLRWGYRYWHNNPGEETIFPLELHMGLIHGATPAAAESANRYMAGAGATQRSTQERLWQEHNLRWGAQRLRNVVASVSDSMASFRQEMQVKHLLDLMELAENSKGRCRPVLSVGRDGVTLREYVRTDWEHASTGTVSVYNRRGERLGTVYLARVPESGQHCMTSQLTGLLEELLSRWEGPMPRLVYVTDAGDNETAYYQKVLRKMEHPRTGKRLSWQRIVDYYHTSERLWAMAAALFGSEAPGGKAWARRMCRLIKRPNGPSRVLHSAGALLSRRDLSETQLADFERAANYIRTRTKHMQYHDYKRLNLPIGSGVTEAACKTVFAQRMKLSGMRWKKDGAQAILNLRVVLLSQIWDDCFRQSLKSQKTELPRPYLKPTNNSVKIAA